jgi:hypothetical protein
MDQQAEQPHGKNRAEDLWNAVGKPAWKENV